MERQYRLVEGRREVPLETRVWRGKVGVLVALLLSLLLAAVTFAVDLGRLRTPGGVAQAWVEATVFGDCERFLELSRRPASDAERRSDDELCAALARRTTASRTQLQSTQVSTALVQEDGERAVVEATVERVGGTVVTRVGLVRDGSSWDVVRDLAACRVGCP